MVKTAINTEIAPTGKLRVGMNANNATLVERTASGKVGGISVELGKFIAGKLGLAFEPVVYASAEFYTASFVTGEWDIIVTGKNAYSEKMVDFTTDLILLEFVYVAAPGRTIADADQVDRAGIKVGVPEKSSADVLLGRMLKFAEVVRIAGDMATTIDLLRTVKSDVDVYATSANNAVVMVDRLQGATIIPGAFHTVAFGVAIPKGRSTAARATLTQLVNEAKAAGIVQKAIEGAGLKGVRVAPV